MPTKDTLFIYCRVSTQTQVEKGYSLESQQQMGLNKAKELGLEPVLFIDAGKSASSEDLANRPQLQEMLNRLIKGESKNVFAFAEDRLSRIASVSERVKNIFQNCNVIFYTSNNRYDYNNYTDEFIGDFFSIYSRLENKKRVERSRSGKMIAVKDGKWGGGITPYGYTTKDKYLVIDEEEAKVYHRIVELSLSGIGANTIARKLTEELVTTKATKFYKTGIQLKDRYKAKEKFVWKTTTVLHIIKNTIYYGERLYKGKIYSAPALIDKKTWDKLQNNLAKNRIHSKRNNTVHSYLLKGLIKCNRCGSTFFGLIKENRGMRQYSCLSTRANPIRKFCGCKSINLDKIENLVFIKLVEALTDSNLAKSRLKKIIELNTNKTDFIETKLKSLNKQLEETESYRINSMRQASKKIISDDDLALMLKEIDAEKNEILEKIAEAENQINIINNRKLAFNYIDEVKARIEDFKKKYTKDFDRKRELCMQFIDKILLDYVDETKQHIIQIILKLKFFDDDKNAIEIFDTGEKIVLQDVSNDIPDLEPFEDDDDDENNGNSGNGAKVSKNIEKLKKKLVKKKIIVTQPLMQH